MIKKMNQGHSFMHLKENLLSTYTASDKHAMWKQVENKSYEGILVNNQTHMWNSGVIALPGKDKLALLRKSAESLDINEWINIPINRMKTSLGKRLLRWADKYWPDKTHTAY